MAKAKKEEIIEDDVKNEELEALEKEEIDASDAPQESDIDQEIDLTTAEKETETGEEIPAEVDAINTDTATAQEANKPVKKAGKKKTTKSVKPKKRSKKYIEIVGDFDKNKRYPLEEAVELVKKLSYSKFDGTISVDVRLSKLKSDESVRGTIRLPNGIEKKMNIAIADEDLIEKIKKGEIGFDILLATPQMMPKLAQVAKILGPRGLMPNPKDGTVVDDPDKARGEMAEMARYRADAQRNIHITIGKVSWESKKLVENIKVALKGLGKYKKDTVAISPTMGPGIKIEY